jgi:tetratricopeptide (TPR) repeat protein
MARTKQLDPAPVAARIGSRIREARTRAGLTQQQLAGDRYTKAYISALENGLARPSMTALDYLARRLGTAPSALIGDAAPTWTRIEADVLLAAGEWQQAADAHQGLLATEPPAPVRAELLLGYAEALSRLDRGAAAVSAASEAAETFDRLGRRLDAARARYWLAYGLYERDLPVEARSLLRAILEELRSGLAAEPDFRMRVLMALAAIDAREEDYGAAMGYLEEASGLADELDDRRRATFLFSLAVTHREAGDLEAAIRFGTQSLALYRSAHADAEAASLENDLALAYLALGDMPRARSLARSARLRFDKLRDERWIAHVAETEAQIDLAEGDLDAGDRHASEALDLAERSANSKAALSARLTRATILRRRGEHDAAIEEYAKAAELARLTGSRPRLRRVLSAWADALAELGRHDQAYELAKEALEA